MSKPPIRICYLVSTLGRTGPTRQLYNLTKYLSRDDFSPSIITLSRNPSDNLQDQFEEIGIRVHSLGLSRASSALFGQGHLETLLLSLQPDILHSQGLRADWLSSQLRHPLVRITTKRNVPRLDYPPLMGSFLGYVAATVHERGFQNIPVVVSCSQSVASSSAKQRPSDVVIHNGIDLAVFCEGLGEHERNERRQRLGFSKKDRVFIFSGPLIPRKNIGFLIDSFTTHGAGQNKLLILGDGPLRDKFEKRARYLDNVILLGNKPNVREYLEISDCFISSSLAEGMPNSVLEALACGLPVLLSDIPPHREIIGSYSNVGDLFPVGPCQTLGKIFDKVPFTKSSKQAARTLVEKRFSAAAMSKKYQNLYFRELQRLGEVELDCVV